MSQVNGEKKLPRYSVLTGARADESGINEFLPRDYEQRVHSVHGRPKSRTTADVTSGTEASSKAQHGTLSSNCAAALLRSSHHAHAAERNAASSTGVLRAASRDPRLYEYLNNKTKRAHFVQNFLQTRSLDKRFLPSIGAAAQTSKFQSLAAPSVHKPSVDVAKLCAISAAVFNDRRYMDPERSDADTPPSEYAWAQGAVDDKTGMLKPEAHKRFLAQIRKCVERPRVEAKTMDMVGKTKAQLPHYMRSLERVTSDDADKTGPSQAKPSRKPREQKVLNSSDSEDSVDSLQLGARTAVHLPESDGAEAIQRVLDFWQRSRSDLSSPQTGESATSILGAPAIPSSANYVQPAKTKQKANPTQAVATTLNIASLLPILEVPPVERTSEQLQTLYVQLRGVEAFRTLSNFMLNQLCGVMTAVTYEANRIVFRQGDVGTCWYVILKGAVTVNVAPSPAPQIASQQEASMVQVAVLNSGQGFGDLALVNDMPRAATINTLEKTMLARVEKVDFDRVLRFTHFIEGKEKMYLLRKVPTFARWPEEKFKSASGVLQWKQVPAGTVLMEEGVVMQELAIIREGQCTAYMHIPIDGRQQRVDIGNFKCFEYFGEEALLMDDQLLPTKPRKSSYGVVAKTDVKLACFTMYDAQVKMKEYLTPSAVTLLALRPNRVMRQYHDNMERAAWEEYCAKVVKGLYPVTQEPLPKDITERRRWR